MNMKFKNIFKKEAKNILSSNVSALSKNQLSKVIGGADEGVGSVPIVGGVLAGATDRKGGHSSDASAGQGTA